jgi:DNA-binding SARP family transcriptional activator
MVYQPPDEALLETAVELWHELGDPIAAARAELVLAVWQDDGELAARRRDELARRGVRPDTGIAALSHAGEPRSAEIEIATLGRFAVLRAGQPIPLAAWQSRKARDLLKLLAARRGRAITRDAAAEALWPNEDPRPLSNRLSVALSTLRKVLDPERDHAPDHFVAADQQSLALRVEHVSLDVNRFLEVGKTGIELAAGGDLLAAEGKLREAENLYTGDFLEEDLYEDWPVDCREEARSLAQEVSRLLARAAIQRGNEEDGARHLRRLLERDPYDADAWTALLAAQLRLRRYGEARRQHAVYTRRMAELAIPPVPLAQTAEARP